MAGHSRAVHKLESAVEVINDVTRMEKQATEKEDERARDECSVRFTPAQVRDMIYSFGVFDRNHDRVLDMDELARVFRACGQNPTRRQLQQIADEADADGNGVIDEKEYLTLLTSHMIRSDEVEREMRQAFTVFDRNGDGRVDKRELIKVLQTCDEPLSQDEADELVTLMDGNKDGTIDIEEFVSFLCKSTAISDIRLEKKKRKAAKQT